MHLQSVYIENLRNLVSTTYEWSPGFNYLYGPNGAGKTAILEAIYVLSMGRSFRSRKTQTLIQHDAEALLLRGVVSQSNDAGAHKLALRKHRSGQSQLRIDGQNRHRMSDLAKLLPVQVMLPDTSEIVLGAPQRRRSYMDWGLFHVEQQFLETATVYSRTLSQRNAWLKSDAQSHGVGRDPWLEQLLKAGVAIADMRKRFLSLLEPPFQALLDEFVLPDDIALTLQSGGLEDLESAEKKLGESWSRDVKFGTTHFGPHRADLAISVGGRGASDVLSRGQAKLVSSALLLAQLEVMREQFDRPTVVLIDDYGAELDNQHWIKFSQTLRHLGCQVLATSNELPGREIAQWADPATFRLFHVEQGVARQEALTSGSS